MHWREQGVRGRGRWAKAGAGSLLTLDGWWIKPDGEPYHGGYASSSRRCSPHPCVEAVLLRLEAEEVLAVEVDEVVAPALKEAAALFSDAATCRAASCLFKVSQSSFQQPLPATAERCWRRRRRDGRSCGV